VTLFREQYRVESARRPGWDYTSAGWYFVTICARQREELMGTVVEEQVQLSAAGQVAQNELQKLPSHYDRVRIDCSVIMPNHVHVIVVIDGKHMFSPDHGPFSQLPRRGFPFDSPWPGSLPAIVRSYKAGVARLCRIRRLEFGWQAGFYDRVLRDDQELNAAREYIAKNPSRWGRTR
jgi:REP-associated tyrosine transposase